MKVQSVSNIKSLFSLPYTRAALAEIQRFADITPSGGAGHKVLCDVDFHGFHLPKVKLVQSSSIGKKSKSSTEAKNISLRSKTKFLRQKHTKVKSTSYVLKVRKKVSKKCKSSSKGKKCFSNLLQVEKCLSFLQEMLKSRFIKCNVLKIHCISNVNQLSMF